MSNPLLNLMAQGESGAAGYNAYNRGTYVGTDNKHHVRGPSEPIDFSAMSLGQVLDRQNLEVDDPNRLFAVGKYQIIPKTMHAAVNAMQLDPNLPFTPKLQDKIFSDYLIAEKQRSVHDYITDQPGATLEKAQHGLASEWASFGDPANSGRSHYPPPNVAHITLAQSADALHQMRAKYRAEIDEGMTPKDAWGAVTNSTLSPIQATPGHAAHAHAHMTHGHALGQGTHGPAVTILQSDLAKLGYHDDRSHPLAADGIFGLETRHAVERFQHDHHLVVDGKVGPLTRQALHTALQQHTTALNLSDPKSPDHALFEQALTGVRALDAHGHPTEPQRLNLAAALVVEAKHQGMTRIDQVALGDDGSRVYIAQHPASLMEMAKLGSVATVAALHTSMAQSAEIAAAIPSPIAASTAPIVQAAAASQALAR